MTDNESHEELFRQVKRWAANRSGWAVESIDGVQLVAGEAGIELEVWNYYPSIERVQLPIVLPVEDFLVEVLEA